MAPEEPLAHDIGVGAAPELRQQLRRETEAVTDEIKKIATYLKAKIKSEIRTDDDAADAILKAIKR